MAGEEKTIICRELLGLAEKNSEPVPEDRTEAYYQNRPCPRIVAAAARILEEYIKEQEAAKSVDL